jgi:hypothetical protein
MHESPVLDKFLVELIDKHGINNLPRVREELVSLVGEVASKLETDIIRARYDNAIKDRRAPSLVFPSSYCDDETDDDSDTGIAVYHPPQLVPNSVFLEDEEDDAHIAAPSLRPDPYSRCRLVRDRFQSEYPVIENDLDRLGGTNVQRVSLPWKYCSPGLPRGIESVPLELADLKPVSPALDPLTQYSEEEKQMFREVTERCRKNVTVVFPSKRG